MLSVALHATVVDGVAKVRLHLLIAALQYMVRSKPSESQYLLWYRNIYQYTKEWKMYLHLACYGDGGIKKYNTRCGHLHAMGNETSLISIRCELSSAELN